MAYPEKDAKYVHKPKFLERLKAEEGDGHMHAGALSGEGRLEKIADMAEQQEPGED